MKGVLDILNEQDELFDSYEGCSEEEISELELKVGYPLPADYTYFLREMGKYAGNFMIGSSAFYHELDELKEAAIELLAENNVSRILPADAFVFWMHQGYQFAFFKAGAGNEKVYYYGEGEGLNDFKEVESLSEFFRIQLQLSGFTLQ